MIFGCKLIAAAVASGSVIHPQRLAERYYKIYGTKQSPSVSYFWDVCFIASR